MKRIQVSVTMSNGTTVDLDVPNPALVRWDFDRAKMNWPTPEQAPMLFTTYLAWATMVFNGQYPETLPADPGVKGGKPVSSFRQFRDFDCLHVDDRREPVEVDPTLPVAEAEPASL